MFRSLECLFVQFVRSYKMVCLIIECKQLRNILSHKPNPSTKLGVSFPLSEMTISWYTESQAYVTSLICKRSLGYLNWNRNPAFVFIIPQESIACRQFAVWWMWFIYELFLHSFFVIDMAMHNIIHQRA